MSTTWSRIECTQGDLTLEDVDAIVNAANPSLRGGGGVDGAIHRAAGPELLAECMRLYPEGCIAGDVRITRGFGLPARHVIHAVGPAWQGGGAGEAGLLAACHERAIDLAAREGLRSLAFPAISCGVFRYPWNLAAEVALGAIARALQRHDDIELVRLVLWQRALLDVFASTRARLAASQAR